MSSQPDATPKICHQSDASSTPTWKRKPRSSGAGCGLMPSRWHRGTGATDDWPFSNRPNNLKEPPPKHRHLELASLAEHRVVDVSADVLAHRLVG